MVNRKQTICFRYTTRPKSHVKTLLEKDLKEDPIMPNKVIIIYSNGRGKIRSFADGLKMWFYSHDWLWKFHIMVPVGTLSKEKKSQLISDFLLPGKIKRSNFNVLCATSGVGNADIDSPNIRAVYRIEFPPSIIDICQEKG